MLTLCRNLSLRGSPVVRVRVKMAASTPAITSFFKPITSPKKATSNDAKIESEKRNNIIESTASSSISTSTSKLKRTVHPPDQDYEHDENATKSIDTTTSSVSNSTTTTTVDTKRMKLSSDAAATPSTSLSSSSSSAATTDDSSSKHVIEVNQDIYNPNAIDFSRLEESIPPAWQPLLAAEFKKPYWQKLKNYLVREEHKGSKIYPPKQYIFRALQMVAPEDIKVVIVGQDPYHGAGQAEGLAFSVPRDIPVPSSLKNMYTELKNDVDGFEKPKHGHLLHWAEQGVLLLNTSLTVRSGEANSHSKFGWSEFTDAIMKAINQHTSHVIFLLWGSHAQLKGNIINIGKHHVLKSSHPSGLSAHRGFIGCKHFSKANELLKKHGKQPIDWQV